MTGRTTTSGWTRRTSRGITAALALGAAAALASCAGTDRATPGATRDAADAGSPIERLRSAAARQIEQPVSLGEVALPPGIPPEQLAPIGDGPDEPGRLSLEAALQRLAAEPAAGDDAAPAVEPDAEGEALRLYLSGRSKLLSGDAQGAQSDLVASLRLDPRPGEVWRELGEAQLALGNRNGALLSMQRALRRQPDDVRVLERLGRLALDRRDYELAASVLGRLRGQDLEAVDPALPFIVGAQLGRSLTALGYVNAALEPLTEAAELPERFTQSTTRQEALALVYRQRGDVWRDIGDAHARLGDFESALEAYERSAILPSLNPASLTPRRIYAALRLGRPAAADAIILDQIIAARGRVDERTIELIAYSAGRSPTGAPELARAIEALPTVLEPADARGALPYLLRARAVALGPEGGLQALRDQLTRTPGDEATLRDLFTRLADKGTAAVVTEAAALAQRHPFAEARQARALVRTGIPVTDLLSALDELPQPTRDDVGASLLRARLTASSGGLDAGAKVLAEARQRHPKNPGLLVASVRVLTALGQYEQAGTLLAELPDEGPPAMRFAKAMALADREEDERALALVEPLLATDAPPAPGDPSRDEVAVLAAKLCQRLGRFEDAERLFLVAIQADAMRDDAYAGLMQIYSPGSPLASEEKLVATARELAAANPSSPTLRWLRAREARNRGQLDLAQRELIELDREYPDRPEVLDLLVDMWVRSNASRDAETWLRGRVRDEPMMGEYVNRLADVLAGEDRAEEAASLLRERLATAPGDLAASRRLERLLRERLNDAAGADALALQRLDRSPRTIETQLERTGIAWRRGEMDAARSALRDALSRPGVESEARQPRVSLFVATLGQEADRSRRNIAEAVELQSMVIDRLPAVSVQAHASRIILLASHLDDFEALQRATLAASAAHETLRTNAFVLAIDELTRPVLSERSDRRDQRERRLGDALRIAEIGITDGRELSPLLAARWLQIAAVKQDAPALRRAIELARERKVFDQAMDTFGQTSSSDDQARRVIRAAVLCEFAEVFINAGKQDEADGYYRLALESDPDNAQANNGLGYRMLERGENIDEAARMIELAYQREPGSEAITDSMGWARYKQGIIHDEPDAPGKPGREGAVTYLARAFAMAQNDDFSELLVPVIADHYADALWVAGERERAISLWTMAAEAAARLMGKLGMDATGPLSATALEMGLNQAIIDEIRTSAAAARDKAAAAREDREPAIAKMHAPPNRPLVMEETPEGPRVVEPAEEPARGEPDSPKRDDDQPGAP